MARTYTGENDTDLDGVVDKRDRCPNTKKDQQVEEKSHNFIGCSDRQIPLDVPWVLREGIINVSGNSSKYFGVESLGPTRLSPKNKLATLGKLDSGGALIIEKNDTRKIIGIASSMMLCTSENQQGYSRSFYVPFAVEENKRFLKIHGLIDK